MKKVIITILAILMLMFAEYRFIMLNICPYSDGNGTIYLEIFNQIDEYDAVPTSEMNIK